MDEKSSVGTADEAAEEFTGEVYRIPSSFVYEKDPRGGFWCHGHRTYVMEDVPPSRVPHGEEVDAGEGHILNLRIRSS
jgi:hypothetical protein